LLPRAAVLAQVRRNLLTGHAVGELGARHRHGLHTSVPAGAIRARRARRPASLAASVRQARRSRRTRSNSVRAAWALGVGDRDIAGALDARCH
jgi:hypothetical protein